MDPKSWKTHYNSAVDYSAQQDYGAALRSFWKAFAMRPSIRTAWPVVVTALQAHPRIVGIALAASFLIPLATRSPNSLPFTALLTGFFIVASIVNFQSGLRRRGFLALSLALLAPLFHLYIMFLAK